MITHTPMPFGFIRFTRHVAVLLIVCMVYTTRCDDELPWANQNANHCASNVLFSL